MTLMQIRTQPATPAPPAAPPTLPPGATFTLIGPQGRAGVVSIPTTPQEVHALLMRREALSDQLGNVSGRRHELAMELAETTEPAARTGLEERLRVLDQRILQIETDLATTGRELSLASPEMVATSEVAMNPPETGGHFEEGMAVGGVSVLMACAVLYFFARRGWKRALRSAPVSSSADSGRLERLEQGMEAIAIEIERVSEGQRFVTKLLSQSQQPHAVPGDGQTVSVERAKTTPERAG